MLVLAATIFAVAARASTSHAYRVPSPDHEQTFAYGSEQNRVWAQRGKDKHLALLLNFTNDPYVDRDNPRLYDNFTFSFPDVILGKDGRTFYYRAKNGRLVPVAAKERDIFGVTEIKLLPNATLSVAKPHGYLSLSLDIVD